MSADAQSTTDLVVHDEPEANRFVLRRGDRTIGWADYRLEDQRVVITHVETVLPLRGRGMAATLMASLLDQLRARGRTVVPVCSYAAGYLRDHPDQHDLLAQNP